MEGTWPCSQECSSICFSYTIHACSVKLGIAMPDLGKPLPLHTSIGSISDTGLSQMCCHYVIEPSASMACSWDHGTGCFVQVQSILPCFWLYLTFPCFNAPRSCKGQRGTCSSLGWKGCVLALLATADLKPLAFSLYVMHACIDARTAGLQDCLIRPGKLNLRLLLACIKQPFLARVLPNIWAVQLLTRAFPQALLR